MDLGINYEQIAEEVLRINIKNARIEKRTHA